MSQLSGTEDNVSSLGSVVSGRSSNRSLRNWTIPKLIAELNRKGIRYPSSARKAELYRILMSEAGSSEEQSSLSSIQLSLSQLQASINGLVNSVSDIQSRVEVLEVQPSTSGQSQATVSTPAALQSLQGINIPTPQIVPSHFLPESLKKDIVAGKDINLASILIASHDVAENRVINCGDVSIVMKAKDARLSRKLSIPEFVLAFSVYRDVVCSAQPDRREELDRYLYRVTDLGQKYGGSAFYDYHRSFSAKAAAALSQFQFVTNWAEMDTELFCRHFAGLRAPTCSNCQSIFHTTDWCPNYSLNTPQGPWPGPSGSQGNSSSVDKLGRPIVYLGKSQLCNNFNLGSCAFNACRALHICSLCFRAHPRSSCPRKTSQQP
ncbi:uncharacterized protein LOC122925402 [Bufo gargarizans]|uniref:uncharacterized protein LOC122922195 n=1 Tax=Bufo gargarizans TaxID=30331 RepID=UPI001CF2C3CF|nr:uncharacterized protein LOC122922195 [Bufo gargarizans]XP_044132699.1 uncharacterized protein LOC122925402 [Bufo gargarizans]